MTVSAQRFGIKAGLNLANYYGDDAEGAKTLTGFQVGGLLEMPLSGGLYLQPEAVLSLKGAKDDEMDAKFKPFYLEVPVKLSYKLNAGPGKFTIGVGPYAGLGLFGKMSAEQEVEGMNISASMNLFTKEGDMEQAILKRFDFGVAGAMGYELPSGLFLNLESSLGLLNVAEDASTKNTVVALTAGFKF